MDHTDQGGAPSRPPRAPRQGRVGILPNPNRKALPPPRRPPLIGRFLQLRSSRRPPLVADPPAAPTPDPEAQASAQAVAELVRARDGRVAEIDIDQLNALAESLAQTRAPRRRGIADHIIRERAVTPPEAGGVADVVWTAPAVDNGAADLPAGGEGPSAFGRLRGYLARIAGRGGGA